MATQPDDLGDFLGGLPPFRVAPPKPKPLTQDEKVRRLLGPVLARLYRDGVCTVADLEADAPGLGVTGRLALALGRGVGGTGGMNLFLDGGQVVPCRDNALNLLTRLGRAGFARWLADEGVDLADFQTWLAGLPAVND